MADCNACVAIVLYTPHKDRHPKDSIYPNRRFHKYGQSYNLFSPFNNEKHDPTHCTIVSLCRLRSARVNPNLIRRTMNSLTAAIQDMGIDHRGTDISVAQELLNGPDVVAIL